MTDCASGDTYKVTLSYPFKFLTPILGDILGGTLDLNADSSAVVLNLAFDPTPGASVQKLVKVANAVNGTAIVNNCLEPDESDSAGFYRSPCHDTTTPDPADTISATFESGSLDPVQGHRRQQRRPAADGGHGRRLDGPHRMHLPDYVGRSATRTSRAPAAPTTAPRRTCPAARRRSATPTC